MSKSKFLGAKLEVTVLTRYLWISFLLGMPALAGWQPTGYSSWVNETDTAKHLIQLGGEPSNYWNGERWTAIQAEWQPWSRGFKATRNRHYVFMDTIDNVVRFSMTDWQGNEHILRTRIGQLFFFDRILHDTLILASPNFDSLTMAGDSITIAGIYPGVDCVIKNRPSGLDHCFIFSPRADSVLDFRWQAAGSNPNVLLVNAFRIFPDSLNLSLYDNDGYIDIDGAKDIRGHLNFRSMVGWLFQIKQSIVNQTNVEYRDTLLAPIYQRLHRIGNEPWLLEGFRMADVAGWPDIGYQHRLTYQDTVELNSDDAIRYDGAFAHNLSFGVIGKNNLQQSHSNGIRFQGVSIPRGSVIDSAFWNLKCAARSANNVCNARFFCEDTSSAATFSDGDDYDNRFRTANYVDWDAIESWDKNLDYISPDIKAPIQEVINRSDWSSGNALVIFIDDNGSTSNARRDFRARESGYPSFVQIYYTTTGGTGNSNVKKKNIIERLLKRVE